MIINPVTGKPHTTDGKEGRETLKSYLKTYKDGLERKERVEEAHKMWEKVRTKAISQFRKYTTNTSSY